MDTPTRHPRELKDVPDTEHFAILTSESIYYDDGYGEGSKSTHRNLGMEICYTADEVATWVKKNAETKFGSPKDYRVIHVKPVKVTTTVTIALD